MRRVFLAILFAAGCIHGSPAPERDENALRMVAQQERWANQALASRSTPAQLEAIRTSDYNAVGRGRGDLKRLIQAIDRGTWVRNTSADLMAQDPDPELGRTFDRAGRTRAGAVQAADEVARALAEAKGGLTIGDLQPGFDAMRKARASEDRLSRLPPRANGVRLAPSPLPLPRPFVVPAARLVSANPELTRELDRLAPQDAAQVRARLADVDKEKAEPKGSEMPAGVPRLAPPTEDVPPPEPREAEAPSPTLTIGGDAMTLLSKRLPRAITLREDGLFELSYDDASYLVDPRGKLIRKEPPGPR
ncbi:MAG TPA: hypothetical protein VMK66_13630 [Myxococcales bacterium]|nr:hypothetical protein [Myxococcales bacterium]